jgi:predicted MFS family arabinose efflux permease
VIGKSPTRTLWIIAFTLGLDALGFGILLPIIPQLLTNPASPHYMMSSGTAPGTGYFLVGCLIAVYPLTGFLSTSILGQLSDRYGRKPLLTLSLAGTSIATAGLAIGVMTRNLPLLFVARAVDGLTGGNVSIARAVIADITEPKDRTKMFGLTTAAFGTGLVVGPFLGGVLADSALVSWFDAATPFWFAAILATLNTCSAWLLLAETHAPKREPLQLARNLKNLVRAYARPQLRSIYLTSFLAMAGNGIFVAFFGAFLIHRYAWDERHIGNFFGYNGLFVIFTQVVTVRRMAKRVAEAPVLRVTLLGTTLMLVVYVLPIASWGLYVVAPFVSTFNGLSVVNLQGLLSRSVGPAEQGEVLGINASLQALAMGLPPLTAAAVASALSPESAIVAATLCQLAAWLAFVTLYRARA